MLSEQEAKRVKEQLLQQIEKFPQEQKEAAKKEIESMSIKQLEEFLVKNNLVKSPNSKNLEQNPTQCVFCSIIEGKIPTHKIDENKQAIATLDINPVSKGHSIIVPKEHTSIEKIPTQAFTLAKKIAKKIKSKLKPKDIQIQPSSFMQHSIINVIPIYENENLNSPKKQAQKEELLGLQDSLEKKPEPEKIKPQEIEQIDASKIWAPRRRP